MKKPLGAGRILANIQSLKGFTTKRQLAEFFGVGPSAVTDWTNRKGDMIPSRRLADASRTHGLRWEWLAYGEGHPYDTPTFDNATGVDLDPTEVALLARVKNSPGFRKAVNRLLGLPDEQIKVIGQLADALKGEACIGPYPDDPARANLSAPNQEVGRVAGALASPEDGRNSSPDSPFLKYHSRYP